MHPQLIFVSTLILSVLLLPQPSNAASLVKMFRRLAQGDDPNVNRLLLMSSSPSPSPSPDSGINLYSGSGEGPSPAIPPDREPTAAAVNQTCDMVVSYWRCQDQNNMTACLPRPGSGHQGSILLVQNNGESSLEVNVTFLPINSTYKDIKIMRHQAKEIDISENIKGSWSIILNAGSGDCVIHMGAPVQEGNFFNQFPYATYVTPSNGAYLLFATALIIGGMWICCKYGKNPRHPDGVPYKELEMEQPESLSSTKVETAEGWDQGWDDDWDEEKAVGAPSGNHVGDRVGNDHTSRLSNNNGWGNDWDD